MSTWRPGDRVQWTPVQPHDYGTPIRGVVADAPSWPPIDTVLVDGTRIPVDLDPPMTIPAFKTTRPYTMTRLWVREQFLEAQR